jgi:hypothetical protein
MLPFISTRKGLEGGNADEAQIQNYSDPLGAGRVNCIFSHCPSHGAEKIGGDGEAKIGI